MNIHIKKLSKEAIIPTKNNGDAGFDLYSTEDYELGPLERRLFKTDIAMSIPYGYFGRIADRSGNALKKGLHTMAGVVDSAYRGEIGVVLINLNYSNGFYNIDKIGCDTVGEHSPNPNSVIVKKGDRIAQLIIERYSEANLIEVDELDQSIRSTRGFGSSGD